MIDDADWQRSLREIFEIQNYIIRIGAAIPAPVSALISNPDAVQVEQRAKALIDARELLAIAVAPATLASVIGERVEEYEKSRRNLIRGGLFAVTALILTTIVGIYIRRVLMGTDNCGPTTCSMVFSVVLLGYGAALGAIGAVSYELFHASGIVKSIDYGIFDDYRSTARVLLGVTFGWIFSVTVSVQALAAVFSIDLTGETDPAAATPADYALILLPFLVGYSSALITGVLDRFVDAIQIVFGIKDATPPKS